MRQTRSQCDEENGGATAVQVATDPICQPRQASVQQAVEIPSGLSTASPMMGQMMGGAAMLLGCR